MKKYFSLPFDLSVLISSILFGTNLINLDVSIFSYIPSAFSFAVILSIFEYYLSFNLSLVHNQHIKSYKKIWIKKFINALILIYILSFYGGLGFVISSHPWFQQHKTIQTILQDGYIYHLGLSLLFIWVGFIDGKGSSSFSTILKITVFLVVPYIIFSIYVSYMVSQKISIPIVDTIAAVIVFLTLIAIMFFLSVILSKLSELISPLIKMFTAHKTFFHTINNLLISTSLVVWNEIFFKLYWDTLGFIGVLFTGILPIRIMFMFVPSSDKKETIIGLIILAIYLFQLILQS